MESHGDWQHVAVAFDARNASAQFYINGFPVERDMLPEVSEYVRALVLLFLNSDTRVLFLQTTEWAAPSKTPHFIDQELILILRSQMLRVPAVVLAETSAPLADASFGHLDVTFDQYWGQADWVLIMTDSISPLEYWLWNLINGVSGNTNAKAAKSLTLNHAGNIKGYPVHYLAGVVDQLSSKTPWNRDQPLPPPASTSESTQCPGPVVSINAIHQEVVLDRIVILGERNSGTNAVEELFRRNLEGNFPIQAGLTEIKHYFQRWPDHGDVETARTLTIMVVRNPYDWLQSMHKMCYCCEDLCADNIPFEEFLHKPFELTLEDPATHEKRPNEGCPVDVNIYNPMKRKFEHVLDARYQKALHFMNVSRWSAGFEVVRWEDILDPVSQEIVFKKIAVKWRLRQKSNTFNALDGDVRFWKPIDNFNATRRRSSSMYLNPTRLGVDDATLRAMCNLINNKLDAYLEQILGLASALSTAYSAVAVVAACDSAGRAPLDAGPMAGLWWPAKTMLLQQADLLSMPGSTACMHRAASTATATGFVVPFEVLAAIQISSILGLKAWNQGVEGHASIDASSKQSMAIRASVATSLWCRNATAALDTFRSTLLSRMALTYSALEKAEYSTTEGAKKTMLRLEPNGSSRYDLFDPIIQCSSGGLQRIGSSGEGGKFLCMETIAETPNCVVYSVGSNGQFDFEASILSMTNCSVHTFDCTYNGSSIDNRRHSYHQICVGRETETRSSATGSLQFMSLADITQMLGHSKVDLLKMDIEGFEYEVMSGLDLKTSCAFPMQISMEVHYHSLYLFTSFHNKPQYWDNMVWTMHQLSLAELAVFFQHIANLGYAIVSRDDNPLAQLSSPSGNWREWTFDRSAAVPRMLWQTYKSRRPPKDGMDAYWSWHELNPGLQTIIHDDAQAHKCIKHLYGDEVSQIYAAFPLSVMRADFWRYAILYAFGGIYADIDVQALRPLDQWLPPEPDGVHWPPNNDTRVAPSWSDCSITIALQSDIFFCQWTIMSAPKHPVLRAVLELIIQRAKDGVDVTYEHFVHKHTGPGKASQIQKFSAYLKLSSKAWGEFGNGSGHGSEPSYTVTARSVLKQLIEELDADAASGSGSHSAWLPLLWLGCCQAEGFDLALTPDALQHLSCTLRQIYRSKTFEAMAARCDPHPPLEAVCNVDLAFRWVWDQDVCGVSHFGKEEVHAMVANMSIATFGDSHARRMFSFLGDILKGQMQLPAKFHHDAGEKVLGVNLETHWFTTVPQLTAAIENMSAVKLDKGTGNQGYQLPVDITPMSGKVPNCVLQKSKKTKLATWFVMDVDIANMFLHVLNGGSQWGNGRKPRLLPDDSVLSLDDPYEIGTSQKFSDANEPPDLQPQQRAAWRFRHPSPKLSDCRSVFGLSIAAGQAPLRPVPTPLMTGGFTLASWFKPQHHGAAARCIASQGQQWALALYNDDCITFLAQAATPMQYTTLLVAPADAWTHIAVSYAGQIGTGKALQASYVLIYINGTLTPFFAQPSKAMVAVDPSSSTKLQLAACAGFMSPDNSSSQWIGDLAGTQLIDGVVSHAQVLQLLANKPVAGTIFALAPSSTAEVNLTAVPAHAAPRDVVEQFSATHTCALPCPHTAAFYGVPKPASLTAMAWIQLADTPRRKEACILSHGSWEKGWKLSMTPQLNLQFTARTTAGYVRDYFSQRMESHGDWQHVAVAYDAHDASVQFYVNGFPVEPDTLPETVSGTRHALSASDAPFTIGRCRVDNDGNELFIGSVADIALWNSALDFLALRMVLHRGLPAARSILTSLDSSIAVIFAIPSTGCQFRMIKTPTFADGWKPALQASSTRMLQSAQQLLRSTLIVIPPTDRVAAATRTLRFIDQELILILRSQRLRVPAVVLAETSARLADASFRHLNVTFDQFGQQVGSSQGHLQAVAAAVSQYPEADWMLIVTDSISPLEYWLWNLMNGVLDSTHAKAAKSLTLNHAGNIKSAGLRHQLTVVGDGRVLKLPYMLYRQGGYPVNYLAGVVDQLSSKMEATSCRSLLIDRNELLAGAQSVAAGLAIWLYAHPPCLPLKARKSIADMDFFYQCAALTLPLVVKNQLRMAWNSWVLDLSPPRQDWNANSDGMLQFHESYKSSAELYNNAVGQAVEHAMLDDLRCNLTVKWMMACGGSWAWEAANMIEHLDRKVQLRVQIQKPFKFCDGHDVLGAAAPSFGENIERMLHLPNLNLSSHTLTEAFRQDDIVVLHRWYQDTSSIWMQLPCLTFIVHECRDYFRVTNWISPIVKRPRYLIGRYMNEVSSLHARLVEQCNILDEVWVPSQHHIEVFAQAGVDRSKLVVIPESLDTNFFQPDKVQPLPLPGRKSFTFLSNFKFEERKNWKALICDKSTIPHIALTGRPLSTGDMMSLYKAADAFVLPTHGEGWGLPLHEAMAMELPTISTGWGGNTQFMTPRNSYLIRVREFESSDAYDDWLRNMKWAKPDERHLSKLMREVFDRPDKARAKGLLARQDVVLKYSNAAVAGVILQRLQQIERQLASASEIPKSEFGLQFQWTIASDIKICSSMPSAKRDSLLSNKSRAESTRNHTAPYSESLPAFCSLGRPVKLAFVTPFPPRHDGLSQYSAHMRTSLLAQCSNLQERSLDPNDKRGYHVQIDVFAIVLDFWNVEHEKYDDKLVKMKICRESYSDYEAAALLINREYDGVMLNLKLGALGGTDCGYAICFAKLLTKPLVTIVHSVTHNVGDAFQATAMHTLAESNHAVVFSERSRLELDTAIGYLPAESNTLQSNNIHAIPHGAHVMSDFPDKEANKGLLGLQGKAVLLTMGYQGPDKCVDHHVIIEQLANELGLNNQVLFIDEHLSQARGSHTIPAMNAEALETVLQAADIYLAIYPDDLFPHPATFYEAMAHGCALLATPFTAALSYMPADAGHVLWDRSSDGISRHLLNILQHTTALKTMQMSAWRASQNMTWNHASRALLRDVLAPLLLTG
ncbi:Initiation-specific alpha-1 [Chlorella vulgaris]